MDDDQQPTVGRKQTHLLAAVLRGVPLLDRAQGFLTDTDVRTALQALPQGTCQVKTGEIKRMRPRPLTAAVGTEARRTSYLYGLPNQGVEPLLQAITQAVHASLVLRVVFGASTQVPPQALSYVLPAVWMAERLTATGLRPPQLHVILASSLGAEIASLPGRDIDEETRLLARSLDRMLAVLAPRRYGIDRTLPGTTGDVPGQLRQLVNKLTPAQRADVSTDSMAKAAPPVPTRLCSTRPPTSCFTIAPPCRSCWTAGTPFRSRRRDQVLGHHPLGQAPFTYDTAAGLIGPLTLTAVAARKAARAMAAGMRSGTKRQGSWSK
ncbi:hypothetical protein [Streptomyces griseorubiginosus]